MTPAYRRPDLRCPPSPRCAATARRILSRAIAWLEAEEPRCRCGADIAAREACRETGAECPLVVMAERVMEGEE